MSTDALITLQQLAERLQVTPKVIYGLRYRGEAPPAIKVGRELRWRLSDVADWEERRRDGGGPHAPATRSR
jgi:predicted DNA-binding transcriptional regulator AlpA